MTRSTALDLFQQATAYTDPEVFAYAARRDLLYNPTFPPEPLRRIWVTACAPFKDFLRELGQTQTSLSRRHGIPARTVRGWALNERECAPYLRLLLAQAEKYIVLE